MRRNLRPILHHLHKEAGSLAVDALEGRTDEQVADLLLDVADALLPLDAIPGAGQLAEILSDALLLHLLRPHVVRWVAAARGRATQGGA